tara:strand:+ start:84 stop:281 length:198 start_codon:yes stop_codon:yes gene_type:complete
MSNRFKQGDLVLIRSKPEKIGIVLEILRRSTQNSDWDSVLVMFDSGDVDAFSPRRLVLKEKNNNI